jgi:aryl-alcohol dehydrogenase-like predicted oxidoreductase
MIAADERSVDGTRHCSYDAVMKYRTFGRTGWKVSEIGFGAWAIGGSWGPQSESDSVAALNRALDLGCNFIDTAQGYGDGKSERTIAQVLKSR